MKKSSYKQLFTLGICGTLLTACSASNDTDPAESSSQIEESQSMDTSSSTTNEADTESSGSEASESSSSKEASGSSSEQKSDSFGTDADVSSDLEMDSDALLLPTYFSDTDTVSADIETNEEDRYTVVYSNDEGDELAEVSGRIYENADIALQRMEDNLNGSVSIPNNEESGQDLGHGITGYGEGAAGNQYFGWEEGNWDFTIHSLTEDEVDMPGIAEKIVDYLEENMLPAPSEKGTVYIDYPQGGTNVTVDIMWQEENKVYELSTAQVPLEALEMVVSMQ